MILYSGIVSTNVHFWKYKCADSYSWFDIVQFIVCWSNDDENDGDECRVVITEKKNYKPLL